MASYISSNANRFYTGLESSYGQTPAIAAQNRFPAVKLTAKNQLEKADRRDKTGSRTFVGIPAGVRRTTSFDLTTYMTSWGGQSSGPSYGPLFQASMGAAPATYTGGAAAAGSSGTSVVFAAPHGLEAGQGVSCNGEIRFVTTIVSLTAVQVNAPFSSALAAGTEIAPSISYFPATELPSVSIFDYWDPSTALQRILCGAAVNRMTVKVNGDFHQFEFEGMAQDLIDSSSFAAGMGQLNNFPVGPPAARRSGRGRHRPGSTTSSSSRAPTLIWRSSLRGRTPPWATTPTRPAPGRSRPPPTPARSRVTSAWPSPPTPPSRRARATWRRLRRS